MGVRKPGWARGRDGSRWQEVDDYYAQFQRAGRAPVANAKTAEQVLEQLKTMQLDLIKIMAKLQKNARQLDSEGRYDEASIYREAALLIRLAHAGGLTEEHLSGGGSDG